MAMTILSISPALLNETGILKEVFGVQKSTSDTTWNTMV